MILEEDGGEYDVIGESTVGDVTWPPGQGRTLCTCCAAAAAWR